MDKLVGQTKSFPRAILHVDGDCFFASCEIACRPDLKGRPVVTGLERGIVSSLSYEAKARGVKRAMTIREVRKVCPEAVFLPSDYETYSLYSQRMFEIVRRFTADVEEYSIDECFADLTGLERVHQASYSELARKIKLALDTELGFTFSVGLAPTKVLAKVASKWQKPSGLTVIKIEDIEQYLDKLDVIKIWGIGSQTAARLERLGVRTALDFLNKEVDWVKLHLTKPYQEIWQELNGDMVYKVNRHRKASYQSISKTKTFTPPSADQDYILSQLSKNAENACIKLRRYRLAVKKVFFFLKTQEFTYDYQELSLPDPTDNPVEIIKLIEKNFSQVYSNRKLFRATGVVLSDLVDNSYRQADIFNKLAKDEKISKIFGSLDKLSSRYGKHTLFLGSSFKAMRRSQHSGSRQTEPSRRQELFKGETARRRVGIPFLGEAH